RRGRVAVRSLAILCSSSTTRTRSAIEGFALSRKAARRQIQFAPGVPAIVVGKSPPGMEAVRRQLSWVPGGGPRGRGKAGGAGPRSDGGIVRIGTLFVATFTLPVAAC